MRGKRWIVSFLVLRVRCRHLSHTWGDKGTLGEGLGGKWGSGEGSLGEGRGPSSHRGVLRVQLLLLGEEAEAVVQRDLPPGKAFLGQGGIWGVRREFEGSGGEFEGFLGSGGQQPSPTFGMGSERSQNTSKVVER